MTSLARRLATHLESLAFKENGSKARKGFARSFKCSRFFSTSAGMLQCVGVHFSHSSFRSFGENEARCAVERTQRLRTRARVRRASTLNPLAALKPAREVQYTRGKLLE